MKSVFSSTSFVVASAIFLAVNAGSSFAAGGRCNVTISPERVKTARNQIISKVSKDCVDSYKGATLTEEQQKGCHKQGTDRADKFENTTLKEDRGLVDPEGKKDATHRDERGTKRPRGNEQSMSRCGGNNGQGKPGSERPSLRDMRRMVSNGELDNGVLSCFCRNDTQAELRKKNTAAGLSRVTVPSYAELPPLPAELRAPAVRPPNPAARFTPPWYCIFGCGV